ncbi:hypothetical protein PM082_009792 [Marasmius tenuissimus]|nr:hypothetical protein PM082_009792 [Marasmius tenuissimus]
MRRRQWEHVFKGLAQDFDVSVTVCFVCSLIPDPATFASRSKLAELYLSVIFRPNIFQVTIADGCWKSLWGARIEKFV